VTAHGQWDTLYAAAGEGLDVMPTVDEAVDWTNALITRIDTAPIDR